jgi:hypothetical protein
MEPGGQEASPFLRNLLAVPCSSLWQGLGKRKQWKKEAGQWAYHIGI